MDRPLNDVAKLSADALEDEEIFDTSAPVFVAAWFAELKKDIFEQLWNSEHVASSARGCGRCLLWSAADRNGAVSSWR